MHRVEEVCAHVSLRSVGVLLRLLSLATRLLHRNVVLHLLLVAHLVGLGLLGPLLQLLVRKCLVLGRENTSLKEMEGSGTAGRRALVNGLSRFRSTNTNDRPARKVCARIARRSAKTRSTHNDNEEKEGVAIFAAVLALRNLRRIGTEIHASTKKLSASKHHCEAPFYRASAKPTRWNGGNGMVSRCIASVHHSAHNLTDTNMHYAITRDDDDPKTKMILPTK